MKKCSKCGSYSTKIEKDGSEHWYRDKENCKLICRKCYRKQLARIKNPELLESDKRRKITDCQICCRPLTYQCGYLSRSIIGGKVACNSCKCERWEASHIVYRRIYRILCRDRENHLQRIRSAKKRGYWVSRID